ncbi:MAG: enoyl-CoA hydratase/isomerase family protein [Thermoanaerobaculia bacterium]|nr:enoyl-CoA hydratase/isomerase family protein [Thermoanaerobaculia bacterium]
MNARFSAAVRDRVAAIAFDDGGMNLLSAEALSELDATLDLLPSGIDVLCFYSAHASVFAAGADMQQMERFTPLEALRFSELGQSLFARIERLPCLTVAAIDGDCFGGALDLSLAFDLRISSPRSRFSHPGSRIGIVTGFGGTSRWRRQTDAPSARALFLGNRLFNAAEARDHELVDLVVDDLRGIEAEIAQRLLARAPAEIRFVKELGRIPISLPPEAHASFARALSAVHHNPHHD